MLKCYKLENGRPVETSDQTGPVYLYIEPTDAERTHLLSEFRLDEHTLGSALDPDELPRMELESDHLAVIYKFPRRLDPADRFNLRVQSIGLFLFRDRLVIVAPADEQILEGRVFTKVNSLQLLFLRVISKCIQHFYGHLKAINDIANELEPKIMRAMENRSLLQMFSIEKSLVYYVTAISANGRVIERLKTNAKNAQTDGLSPEMLEFVDDLAIENAQCLEQAQVYANVFAGLMDARASIISNNLNIRIKALTLITIGIMLPTLVVSVFSMNVVIPIAWYKHAFWVITGLAATSSATVGFLWWRKKW
jgi:magnesium transporter